MFRKTRLITALLGGFLLLDTFVPTVAADDCRDRVRKAEENVKKQTDRHGEHSKQAEQARYNLDKVRRDCHMDEPAPEPQRGFEDQHRNPR